MAQITDTDVDALSEQGRAVEFSDDHYLVMDWNTAMEPE